MQLLKTATERYYLQKMKEQLEEVYKPRTKKDSVPIRGREGIEENLGKQ